MGLSDRIKPISYLRDHAEEVVRTLADGGEPLILTQDGNAKAVMLDIHSYDRMQESLALLKVLAIGRRQVEAGQMQPAADVVAHLREQQQAEPPSSV